MIERDPNLPQPLPRVSGIIGERGDSIPQPIDLHLDGNEGQPPPEDLIDVLHEVGADVISAYPSTSDLEADLAALAGVDPDRVLVTAGAEEGLERVFRAFLGSSRNFVLPEPTFEMLPRYGQLVGAELRSIQWLGEPFPTDEIISRIDDKTGAVFVVSPNNPTGLSATEEDIDRIARAAPHALLVADLAYAEFAETDPTRAILRHRNVIVARTLSKAWGLAGLRVAYLIGDPNLVRVLRKAGPRYPVSGPSVALARAWLSRGRPYLDEFVGRVARERSELSSFLIENGCEVWPSQANFVLTKTFHADWVLDGLRGLGISVRAFVEPALAGCLRITVPGESGAFDRLTQGVASCLRPDGILFAMEAGLPPREELEKVHQYARVGVATTGSRESALERIRNAGCESVVDAISGGDGVANALADGLARLGARRAWLWAHEPQWMTASRDLGVVPMSWIGWTDGQVFPGGLLRAGCARVCRSFHELLEHVRATTIYVD